MYPTRNHTLGWPGTIVLLVIAVALTWLVFHGRGPNACPWPAGDHRNPSGCVTTVTTTQTATITKDR